MPQQVGSSPHDEQVHQAVLVVVGSSGCSPAAPSSQGDRDKSAISQLQRDRVSAVEIAKTEIQETVVIEVRPKNRAIVLLIRCVGCDAHRNEAAVVVIPI